MNSYLDIYIPKNSIKTVLLELARCLSLFPNLHTVQLDIFPTSVRRINGPMEGIFEETFKNYSYPQIRNVFVTASSVSFLASCPQAKRVGMAPLWTASKLYLLDIVDCGRKGLEVLEDFGDIVYTFDACRCAYLYLFSLSALH